MKSQSYLKLFISLTSDFFTCIQCHLIIHKSGLDLIQTCKLFVFTAALLVSARLHGFNRTVREVVKTVRISDTTIRKRLGDFRDTPSSQLTIDEFQKIDLEEEQDPPSFTQARKRAKQQLEELNKPEITSELESFQNSINKALGIDTRNDKPEEENEQVISSENFNRTCENNVLKEVPSVFIPPHCIGEQTNTSCTGEVTAASLNIDDLEGIVYTYS